MNAMQLAKVGGAATGAAIASFAAYSGWAWARYGHAHPQRHPPDPLLDRFLPGPEVDEYHHRAIGAPAPVTNAVAKHHDFQGSPLIWGSSGSGRCHRCCGEDHTGERDRGASWTGSWRPGGGC
jgi:hypothetical protein